MAIEWSEQESDACFNADAVSDGATASRADGVDRRATEATPNALDHGDDLANADRFSRFEFLSIEETAEYLRLDRKTVYAMIRRGDLPGVRRCGRTFRVHRPSVISWFAAKSRPVHRRGER